MNEKKNIKSGFSKINERFLMKKTLLNEVNAINSSYIKYLMEKGFSKLAGTFKKEEIAVTKTPSKSRTTSFRQNQIQQKHEETQQQKSEPDPAQL